VSGDEQHDDRQARKQDSVNRVVARGSARRSRPSGGADQFYRLQQRIRRR
jgi:hypothetical protein